MNTLKLILLAAVLTVLISSCRKGGPIGVKGKGANVTETKNLTGFDKIHLSIDADIFYMQDSIYKVEISAQQNILAILKSEVENHTLKFDYRRNVWEHNKVKITVHSPDLNEIDISGNGDFTVQNTLNTNALELNTSGSGSIILTTLNANNLKATISGIGDVKIARGTLKTEDFNISGFGNINAENVITVSSISKISGAGDITINVSESLDATISGIGDIRYRGKPTIKSNISGSGKIIPID